MGWSVSTVSYGRTPHRVHKRTLAVLPQGPSDLFDAVFGVDFTNLGRRTHAALGHYKARGGGIRAVFDRRATPPDGMHRPAENGKLFLRGH